MKRWLVLLLLVSVGLLLKAQPENCTFQPPFYTIHFGAGAVNDINEAMLPDYRQVFHPCPTDGHYTYAPTTNGCFKGDWLDLTEDHTPGDQDGNMLLVNAAYSSDGVFLITTVKGFKGGTTYQFGAWLMNLCRITKKCPSLLLPDIKIRLQTPEGKLVAQFNTGELQRLAAPQWKQYHGVFTMPPAATALKLSMIDDALSGCGNDFALDDITFQECIKGTPSVTSKTKTVISKKQPSAKQVMKKKEITPAAKKQSGQIGLEKPSVVTPAPSIASSKPSVPALPRPPATVTTRTNLLIKRIESAPGDIRIDLYDNGQIDGDTISVYHNNRLVVAHAALSARPITFYIKVDAALHHHELIMVANNLGSIPPNTSLMIVTAGGKRHEVFISSSEQKNAKVIIDLQQ